MDLTIGAYNNLKNTGMLFEFYPEATGDWHVDVLSKHRPHIMFHNYLGKWLCLDAKTTSGPPNWVFVKGYGTTPEEAYQAWFEKRWKS